MLADREEGAQFWHQYAASGGQAIGAVCLYLMHVRRGEWRDARYWAKQVEALEDELCQYALVSTPGSGGVEVRLALPVAAAVVPEDAVREALEDLDVDQVDGLGTILQPSAELARQLNDLVTADR
ncbi:hypothetical protein ABZX69_37685 [Streptomyces sp. NPDC004074]